MSDSIREIRVQTIVVPMPEPHRTAGGTITESPLVLVDVQTEDGVVGHGIIFTYARAALRATAQLTENLAALVKSERAAPAEISAALERRCRLLGTQGLTGMAIAGIDMALWDARARAQRTSLVRLLGATEKSVPAYGAIGFDGEQGSARVAEQWAKRGFSGVKAKIGYPTVAEDVRVVRAIRSAAGERVAVMVDYNQSLTPAEAVRRARILDGEGLAWIEEPVLAHDFAGHAAVARETATPIQAGENWWGPHDVRQAIDARASDFVMLDAMKIGGVTGWMRAAALAEAHSIPVSSHLWPELSAQLLSATPTAHWLEYADWWNPALREPLRIVEGRSALSGVTGSGISWDEKAAARFAA